MSLHIFCQNLPKIRQQRTYFIHQSQKYFFHFIGVPHQFYQDAAVYIRRWNSILAPSWIKPAKFPHLAIPPKFPPQALNRRVRKGSSRNIRNAISRFRQGCTPGRYLLMYKAMDCCQRQMAVYASRNPATLAHIPTLLVEKKHQPELVQPLDMFPQTYHIKCVALLKKSKP